jgi:hypothetical protein
MGASPLTYGTSDTILGKTITKGRSKALSLSSSTETRSGVSSRYSAAFRWTACLSGSSVVLTCP